MVFEKNQLDFSYLDKIKNSIEKLDKSHHIEIGIILKKNNIALNENNNGIFINLTSIPKNIIDQIVQYIDFVKQQEILVDDDEKLKQNLENTYFKNNKEIITSNLN
tara:strand:+ start:251 stop:568 length:318 start_codon:yes stop_codon:yes gene_type:complete